MGCPIYLVFVLARPCVSGLHNYWITIRAVKMKILLDCDCSAYPHLLGQIALTLTLLFLTVMVGTMVFAFVKTVYDWLFKCKD